MKKVTIYDIARECNCTAATVSKVFNGKGVISDEKRREIMNAIKKLGYIPSNAAKNLATNKSHLIGIVLHDSASKSISHELFSKILNYFRIEVEKKGYEIMLLSRMEEKGENSYLKRAIARDLSGIFILCADYGDPSIMELVDDIIPTVSFDWALGNYSISTDGEDGLIKIVDFLVENGHKDIVFFDTGETIVSRQRLSGFLKGLEKNHIEKKDWMIIPGEYYFPEAVEKEVEAVLKINPRPTAVIMPDDYSAVQSYRVFRRLGIKIPHDLSVVGFDGIELSELAHPRLTTISQDCELIGKEAAMLLLKQINNEEIINKHNMVNGILVPGTSVKKIN